MMLDFSLDPDAAYLEEAERVWRKIGTEKC
jgi:hypothetical protein